MSLITHKAKIARISTTPFFVETQLRTQLIAIYSSGYDLTIIAGKDEFLKEVDFIETMKFIYVPICRKINLCSDLKAVCLLWRIFVKNKFDIVHSTTPKAGLLCAIAGVLARIPVRLHTFTGQPWVTMGWFKKILLKSADRITSILNTGCYADSDSQKKFLIENSIISDRKITVIGSGSLAGVNLDRFSNDKFSEQGKRDLKESLGIGEKSNIITFIGRVTRDKGIFELFDAFNMIVDKSVDTYLLLVGPCEKDCDDFIKNAVVGKLLGKVKYIGFSNEPEKYLSISDLLCLPSHREGFGTSVIEAASMGVPTVGTNICGLSDAIIDGVTGALVPSRDAQSLFLAIMKLLDNTNLRLRMGAAAKKRVEGSFSAHIVNNLLIQEYNRLLELKKFSHTKYA